MKIRLYLFLAVMGLSLFIFSCEKEEETPDDTTSTSTNTTSGTNSGTNTLNTANLGSSHNNGKNCLGCHKFTAAGSVYKKDLVSAYPGSVVKLTTLPNGGGSVVATLTTDNTGNIHTSSGINFGTGLYVSAMGNTTTKYMSSAITGGACNSCHGISTAKVWTE